MEVAVAEPLSSQQPQSQGGSGGGGGVVRREEWRRRGSGGLQHTRIEATHWTAPGNSYGKVVEGVSCVGSDGRSLRARRQVEVMSARGPGLLQVLTSTHTTSHSHSSSTTSGFGKNFDDLQLSVHPLDVSTQKDRLSVGRSGAMGTRRPPSKFRPPPPQIEDGASTVSRLRNWFDVDSSSQQQQLQSPSIVANGTHKFNGCSKLETRAGSEDSLYDSCPEKESVFKDESEQLDEWRRASKIRRSLQYPSRSSSSRPLDLPDNWGSVSRIKKELESAQNGGSALRALKTASLNMILDEVETPKKDVDEDDFLIKPSTLKKSAFIDVDTLNELRGRLRTTNQQEKTPPEPDDGIDETAEEEKRQSPVEERVSVPSVRSYVFGMEAALLNQSRVSGTNSLESRVSKLVGGRGEDWHARRKSYGFERVTGGHKSTLSSHEKNNMESSTDSGICRSTEVVNSVSQLQPSASRSTIVTLGSIVDEKKEDGFENWLQNNRRQFGSSFGKYSPRNQPSIIAQSSNQISISIQEDGRKENGYADKNSEDYALKRHTIAVDQVQANESSHDIFEKKNKKVEFCKTEVHFTADSGKVNIVETDGKPPSTNNFRRRRRNSGATLQKENETNNSSLPVTRFGDSYPVSSDVGKVKEPESDVVTKEPLKLNYAIITEIKSKDTSDQNHETSDLQNGTEDGEQPRGILKNKPVKPKPYHLGEDKTVLSEINNTQYATENNVWGVKLKPIQSRTNSSESRSELWNSSTLPRVNSELNESTDLQNGYGKIEKSLSKSQVDVSKGYSTKINFGNGDPIVESSYKSMKDKLSIDLNETKKIECSKDTSPSTFVSKYLNFSSNPLYKDDLKPVSNTVKSSPSLNDPKPSTIQSKFEDKDPVNGRTFADSISTPRSLMPTRGSARKLKEHELSYFGVKSGESSSNQNSLKRQTNKTSGNETKHMPSITKPKEEAKSSDERYRNSSPIYQNVQAKTPKAPTKTSEVSMKRIKSGESIIDELTKAADEILQALNDFSDDESTTKNSKEPEGYKASSQPLSTISENKSTWSDKAVQTIIAGTKRYTSTLLASKSSTSKARTSSNSSLESITRDACSRERKKQPPVVVSAEPERPQRKKSSSGEVTKARRLQRASSRDALLHVPGSSSEDIAGHLDTTRVKKSSRRSKHSSDSLKRDESRTSLNGHSSSHGRREERKKESSRSASKYISGLVPEIRHKTTVSTIASLAEPKSRSSRHSRTESRTHREGTISSMARDLLKLKERSRSTDTSLERDSNKERASSRHHSSRSNKERSAAHQVKPEEQLKKISEESDETKGTVSRSKFFVAKKTSASSPKSASVRNIQRTSHGTRTADRLSSGTKVTNTRTEYDKNLRLI